MDVSVVIPCHNAGPYLAQTIGSVLDQTHAAHEIIVVDDGSTDDSLQIALRFRAAAGSRIRVFSERSGNAARTRNLGALAATGDAIKFLDADDVVAPDTLEALVDGLREHPGGVAVCPWYRLEQVAGRWVRRPPSCRPRRPGEHPLSAWLTGWYHPPCSVLWSRAGFEQAGRWEESFNPNDDGDLMMRALATGVPFVEVRGGAGYYRRMPQGQSSLSGARTTREGLAARIRVVEKIGWWLEERGRLDEHRGALTEALERIVQDAEGHVDVAERAEKAAQEYAPRRGGRIRRKVVRSVLELLQRTREGVRRRVQGPSGSRRLRSASADEAVTFGLARIEDLRELEAPPAGPEDLTRPRVSVIIPTYNRAGLLPRALDSVLAQSVPDLEVLVVDDGSTDATRDVAVRYDDPRIRYLAQPRNLGAAAARNRGMRESRGEYIAFLDSDDEWLPGKLARQLDVFRRSSDDVGLVYGGVQDDDGRGGGRTRRAQHRGDLYRDLLVRNVLHGGGSNVVIRRRVVATVGFFDERLPAVEDHDYWLRVARFFVVENVEEPVIRYHDPSGAERKSLAVQQNLEGRFAFYRKHRTRMRRQRVAHLYLVATARRHLSPAYGDRRGARRAARQAVLESPFSTEVWRVLGLTTVPGAVPRFMNRRRSSSPAACGSSRLRILLYSPTDPAASGGVQAVFRRLGAQLRERGHSVRLAWARPGSRGLSDDSVVYPLVYAKTSRGLPVPSAVLPALRGFLRLFWGLARFRPHVVNVHFLQPELVYFLWLRRLFRYRLVLSAHGSDVLLPWNGRALRRHVPKADAITAVTPALAEHIEQWPGVPHGGVEVIPNGVDREFWQATGESGAVDRRAPIIVSIGRLHRVKGHDILLRALAAVRAQVPDAQLIVIGGGDQRHDLERLVSELDLQAAVTFTGELPPEGVRDRLARARVFVLPSRSEGMPLSLLEAMSAGVPVVASSVGGVADLLTEGAGLLVPPDDPAALAGAITPLLVDDRHARELSEEARHRALMFDVAAMAADYERAFAACMVDGDRPQTPER